MSVRPVAGVCRRIKVAGMNRSVPGTRQRQRKCSQPMSQDFESLNENLLKSSFDDCVTSNDTVFRDL